MICEFCKGDIPDGASVCMHCARESTASKAAKGKRLGGAVAVVGVALVSLLVLLVVTGSRLPDRSPSDRIRDSCAREFPDDQSAQTSCFLAVAVKKLDDEQAQKLKRATEGAQ